MITDTGFFPDGRWTAWRKAFRTEGEGEQLVENVNRDLLAMALRQLSPGLPDDAVDEYAKAFGDAERRRSHLDLYRSGDFAKLEPYDGKLAALGVPAVIVWGAKDEFAPVGGAYRLGKQLAGARLVVLDDAGHFVMEDDPSRVGGRGEGVPAGSLSARNRRALHPGACTFRTQAGSRQHLERERTGNARIPPL